MLEHRVRRVEPFHRDGNERLLGFLPARARAVVASPNRSLLLGVIQLRDFAGAWRGGNDLTVGQHIHAVISGRIHVT